jgi:ABC-2 type transport system permease protein
MNTILTLVRRELLEHRSIFFAPAVLAAIILAGALWTVGQGLGSELSELLRSLPNAEPAQVRAALSSALGAIILPFWLPFNGVMSVVFFFYLLDCLHSERKDRSVLFWRSLPVSDTQTVVSKLATAAGAIPLVELVMRLKGHSYSSTFPGKVRLPFLYTRFKQLIGARER